MIATTSSHSRHKFSWTPHLRRQRVAGPASLVWLRQIHLKGNRARRKISRAMRGSMAPAASFLDVSLPGISGLDFQQQLRKAGVRTPIIFLTAHGDMIPRQSLVHLACQSAFDSKPRQLIEDRRALLCKRRSVASGFSRNRGLWTSPRPRYRLIAPD